MHLRLLFSNILFDMGFRQIVICILFVSLATGMNAQKKYAPALLIADLDTLYHQLWTTHPEVDAYISKSNLQAEYQKIKDSLTDSLTQRFFFQKMAPFYAKLKDAHGSFLMPSQAHNEMILNERYFLPIRVHSVGNNLFVIEDKDTLITPGSKLLNINGIAAEKIASTLMSCMPSDGDIQTLKHRLLEGRFQTFLPLFFEIDSLNIVEYLDYKTGVPQKIEFPGMKITAPPKTTKAQKKLAPQKNYIFEIYDNPQLAHLKIKTFSSQLSHRAYRKFLRKSFKTIKEKNIKNLVIDIRKNTGGSPERAISILKYISKGQFNVYNQNIIRSSPMSKKNVKDNVPLTGLMLFLFPRMSTKEIISVHKSPMGSRDTTYYDMDRSMEKKFHFDGNVYLLVDGMSASASGLMSNTIEQQNLATIVGEEVGCTTNGCFGQAIYFTLPNTKLRARISMFRFMSTQSYDYPLRGVIPDHEVPYVVKDLIEEEDTQLEFVRKLILEK